MMSATKGISSAIDVIHQAGYLNIEAKTGTVTYIQRFGSSLNLNIHFRMLFLKGVITQVREQTTFKGIKAPSHNDMEALVHTINYSIADYLTKRGLI